jgi:hypothetical protein
MSDRDPFDWLRAANPVPPGGEDDEHAAQILRSVLDGRTPPTALRRPRRRRVVLAAAAAVAVTAAAAATWVATRSTSDPGQVACFAADSLDADRAIVDRSTDPVGACREVWPQLAPGSEVPPLQTCVLPSGVLGLFPGDDPSVCDQLGLARGDPRLGADERAQVEVEEELRQAFGERCVPLDDGVALARGALARAGLDGWRVEQRLDRDDPCSSLAVDRDRRTITVVPVPPSDPEPPTAQDRR